MSERAQITLQFAIVLGVLAAAVYGIVSSAQAQPPAIVTISAGPDPSLIAQTVRSPSPSPAPSPPPAPVATPSPTPTPSPRAPALVPYAFAERPYTGVELGRGWTVLAPYDGRVELHFYQLLEGQIREDTAVAGVPRYAYVEVFATDGRRMRFRPGALGPDTELIAKDGLIKAGDDLFRVIGEGPSSWRDFYDPSISFQIVVSLQSAAGSDFDATPLIKVKWS
ncbi:MAG: hypothetical protein HYU87_09825 [Chloroflexi bacterium]|nr:hypothetical protein [Chloroflexota bacterium]